MRLRELIQTEMRDRRDAYQRDYDSSVSGMGVDHDFRNRERNAGLEHETNNIAIAINGKTWKVVPCKGYADSREEREYLQHMKNWAEKKSASSGKKWSVHLTGAPITESASAGATSSANVATVANPDYANNANKKPVKSVNALDQDEVSLFGTPMETVKSASGKKAAIIKRR
jgi:hypothetical protein